LKRDPASANRTLCPIDHNYRDLARFTLDYLVQV
jgi:hypothetical protein